MTEEANLSTKAAEARKQRLIEASVRVRQAILDNDDVAETVTVRVDDLTEIFECAADAFEHIATTAKAEHSDSGVETLPAQLDAIRAQADHWRKYDKDARAREGLETGDDTHIIAPPTWPSHGQLKAWSAALTSAVAALSSPPESSAKRELTDRLNYVAQHLLCGDPLFDATANYPQARSDDRKRAFAHDLVAVLKSAPAPAEARSESSPEPFDWTVKPPEIPSVERVISYLRDFAPGAVDTTDSYMMRWAADHLANLKSRAEHWQRVAESSAPARSVSLALQEIERLATLETTESLSATIVRIGQIAKAARS